MKWPRFPWETMTNPLPPERSEAPLGYERYHWALKQLDGPLMVADVGCGLGYGSAILRQRHFVIGLDNSQEAIISAAATYPGPYLIANCERQTFKGFDAVVCIEAMSHMIDPYTWLTNLDVPKLVISAPITPSSAIYPWRKHDIPESTLRQMFAPKWAIADVLYQEASESERYLTIYACR